MFFSEMLNNELKSFLYTAKNTSFSKNVSIKTLSKQTREIMKCFCQIYQIFEDD